MTDPDVPNTNLTETLDSLARSEGVVYASVAKAIMDRFADGDTAHAVAGEAPLHYDPRRDERTKGALQKRDMTIWIGYLIIQCASKIEDGVPDGTTQGISEQKLLDTWQNLVPRQWWGHCDVDALIGYETESGSGRVQRRESDSASASGDGKGKAEEKVGQTSERRMYFIPSQRASEGHNGGGGRVGAASVDSNEMKAPTATATAGKRNWHERFNRERMGGR